MVFISIIMGWVVLIGFIIVIGRCFILKYLSIYEERIINDLIIINLCIFYFIIGILSIVFFSILGVNVDNKIKGRNIRLEKSVLKNNIGKIVLFFNVFFLNML